MKMTVICTYDASLDFGPYAGVEKILFFKALLQRD
jgi:hypothetical protein